MGAVALVGGEGLEITRKRRNASREKTGGQKRPRWPGIFALSSRARGLITGTRGVIFSPSPFFASPYSPSLLSLWTRSRGLLFLLRRVVRIVRMRQAALIHHGTAGGWMIEQWQSLQPATTTPMIHPSVDPSTKPRVVVSWNGRDGERKKKRCVRDDANEKDGRWLPRYLTSSVFVLCHLFLNSSPLISTRRRPTFPRSSCSVRPCLVITSLLFHRMTLLRPFFFGGCTVCLSHCTRSFVRCGARVANSSHGRDRFRQYRHHYVSAPVIRCCGTVF